VVEWFYSGIGGIKADPSSPGMKHFTIAPQNIAELTYCKTSYNNLFGKIRSEWKRDNSGKLNILIEVPENTSAAFVLPEGKQTIKTSDGQTFLLKQSGNKYQTEFQSGIYQFEVL
jgi:alpha-L-rhamnosidase